MQKPLDLPHRIHAYLDRQIAWLEDVLSAANQMDLSPDDEVVARLAERVQRQCHALDEFACEQHGLLAEWRNVRANFEPERGPIREKAQYAAELTERLAEQQQRLLLASGQVAAEIGRQLAGLRRGHGLLQKYRVDDMDEGYRMDRNA